ncbi:MAG: branched-chain amino acid ABC transporter permease [Myxococcales bacterium]
MNGAARWFVRGVLLLVLLVLPHFIYPVLALDILCYGLFALAFDIVFGYCGLLSFGHAAFWGVSGYAVANVLTRTALPVPVALVLGAATALVIGLPIGFLSIRSTGIYFSMITLAFGQMIDFIAKQADAITGGDNGMPGIPRPPFAGIDFSNAFRAYYFGLGVVVLGFALAYRVVRSPFGQALRAIRDNETRAKSVGYDPNRQKLVAFLISAGLSGVAGALHVIGHGVVSLDAVNWTTSGTVVMIVLLGGSATFLGPAVGATLVLLLRDVLASSTAAVGVVTGAVFVVTVLFFRRGVVGALEQLDKNRKGRTPPPAAPAAAP